MKRILVVAAIAAWYSAGALGAAAQTEVPKSFSDAEQDVLALEEQMDALLRSNSAERTALWAEEMVYINNNGAVFDKARLAPAVSAGEVKMESLEVTERKIRVYGDVAVVTALERMRASFRGKEPRDHVQRYTRIWARRDGKWYRSKRPRPRIRLPKPSGSMPAVQNTPL
jgi:ketosteroid isomerase-like protein